MNIEVGGLLGLLLLAAVIWAILNVIQSHAGTGIKVLWILGLILLPVIGFIVWLIAGPRAPK
ncbi:MAG: PLD nuclease N-terminal domain-containing protein [Aquisalimonadaceae bacterium]